MYDAYCRVFTRCGLEYVIVEAETGEMGGSGSHQFTVPCESGEDTIVYAEDGSYAANLEKAAVDPLPRQTAAGPIAPIEEVHTPAVGSIEAVCCVPEDHAPGDDQDPDLLGGRPGRGGPGAGRSRGQPGEAHQALCGVSTWSWRTWPRIERVTVRQGRVCRACGSGRRSVQG